MEIQRLRNLTTGILHTDIGCVYEDLGMLIGINGLMTHMLPRAMNAVEPWLREKVVDPSFWDDKYDPDHSGDYDLPGPTEEDRRLMLERYRAAPDPLEGKETIVVSV